MLRSATFLLRVAPHPNNALNVAAYSGPSLLPKVAPLSLQDWRPELRGSGFIFCYFLYVDCATDGCWACLLKSFLLGFPQGQFFQVDSHIQFF
jgi:hypothetical protein